jgi:hypothetical protein
MAATVPGADEREIFRLRKASGRDGRLTWQLRQDPDRECGEWTQLREALDQAVRHATAAAPARLIIYNENGTEAASRDFDPE